MHGGRHRHLGQAGGHELQQRHLGGGVLHGHAVGVEARCSCGPASSPWPRGSARWLKRIFSARVSGRPRRSRRDRDAVGQAAVDLLDQLDRCSGGDGHAASLRSQLHETGRARAAPVARPTAPSRVWYATFTDPRTTDGYWLHHEVVAPDEGPAYAHGWCAVFPFDGRRGPSASARPRRSRSTTPGSRRPGAHVDGATLRGAAGDLGWDLAYADTAAPLYTFPRGRGRRRCSPRRRSCRSRPPGSRARVGRGPGRRARRRRRRARPHLRARQRGAVGLAARRPRRWRRARGRGGRAAQAGTGRDPSRAAGAAAARRRGLARRLGEGRGPGPGQGRRCRAGT